MVDMKATTSTGVRIDGPKLRTLRKLTGHGLLSFAERCEVSPSYLCEIENEVKTNVSPEIFARLCDQLGIIDRSTLMKTAKLRRAA